jgi:zinc transporter ZupT
LRRPRVVSCRCVAPTGTLFADFPIAGVFVALGVYIMFLTERMSLDAMAAAEESNCEASSAASAAQPSLSRGGSARGAGFGGVAAAAATVDLEAPAPADGGAGTSGHGGGAAGGGVAPGDPHSHEHLSALVAAREIASQHAGHAHGGSAAVAPMPPQMHAHSHAHGAGSGHGHSHAHANAPHAPPPPPPPVVVPVQLPPLALTQRNGHGHSHAHAYVHAHGSLLLSLDPAARPRGGDDADGAASAHSGASGSKADAAAAARRVMTARLLEVSIVVHSFIIGLNLGTTLPETPEQGFMPSTTTSTTTTSSEHAAEKLANQGLRPTVALIIVLCFHQFFEGIALGSYIAELRHAASGFAKTLMASIFALTVPVGVWVGIGVAESYAPGSQRAVWVTGTLNGVTGGMLLYSALITFMAEEFSRDDLAGAAGRATKRRMYLAMLLGAAAMALLAIWA